MHFEIESAYQLISLLRQYMTSFRKYAQDSFDNRCSEFSNTEKL